MKAPSPVAPDPHIQAVWMTLTGSRVIATHLTSPPTITSLCKEFKAWETLDNSTLTSMTSLLVTGTPHNSRLSSHGVCVSAATQGELLQDTWDTGAGRGEMSRARYRTQQGSSRVAFPATFSHFPAPRGSNPFPLYSHFSTIYLPLCTWYMRPKSNHFFGFSLFFCEDAVHIKISTSIKFVCLFSCSAVSCQFNSQTPATEPERAENILFLPYVTL